ncbi:MAG TPA: hypothetical protein GX729_01250 [Firmicutes bacterium]|nr:hypothetical protein [Bacillota bacterium]
MEPRFAKIWTRDEEGLASLARRLQERLRSDDVARAVAVVEKLYGAKLPDLEIILILSRGKGSTSGGANEGPGRIAIGALETEDINSVVEVVIHESIHLLEPVQFIDIYHGISKTHGLGEIRGEKYWSADIMVGEVIVGALVPGGVLAPLVGGKIRDLASEAERLRAAGHHDHADRTALTGYYLPLMQEYIDAAKPIDAELIERAIAIFHSRRDEFSRTSPH